MKYPDLINPEMSWISRSQQYNLDAGMLMAHKAKTSLGPRGMEKMYVDIIGEETVTAHGGAFMRKFDVDHPAAKAVIDGVNTVDTHVGDGTISAAILVGALLEQVGALLKSGIPTATIMRGFEIGAQYALETLDCIRIRGNSKTDLQVVSSCLAGKTIALANDNLAEWIVEAVLHVGADTDMIKIEEKPGNFTDVQLIRGTVIDKPADNTHMPRSLFDTQVLLLNDTLEATRTRTESSIDISSPEMMGAFKEQENFNVMAIVEKVVNSGAQFVVSRKGIGEMAQAVLARMGVMTVRRAKYNDLWWLEKATGATTCTSVEDISPHELGHADTVRQEMVGRDSMIFVESATPRSVTFMLRASSKRYLDEFHRNVLNAIRSLRNYRECPFVVYGGGACEAILARRIRERAPYNQGKIPLILGCFATALEEIPMTLARNVGMDTLDAMPMLRHKCATEPSGWWGVDSASRSICRIHNVIDTYLVKKQIIITAQETANQILNVDDTFMKDIIDNTHCHLDGTVHAHKDPGRNHNHWEQEGLEQRQMHQYY